MIKNVHPYSGLLHTFIYCVSLLAVSIGSAKAQPGATIFNDNFTSTALGSLWATPTSWTASDGAASFYDGPYRTLKTKIRYSQPSYILETAAKGFTASYHREFRLTFGQATRPM